MQSATTNLDPGEIDQFAALAAQWWDTSGPFRMLHRLGPTRLAFIRKVACDHFGLRENARRPLAGITCLDVGCGGGLIAEPLARLGATVTAIDPAEENIEAARLHAASAGLNIDYRATTAEAIAGNQEAFDIVTCLEVVEHVPDPATFVATLATLVRPGGQVILSTINRTPKSYALAIVGAEYVLRWLPRGTHNWSKFVTPTELRSACELAGLRAFSDEGVIYDVLNDAWKLSSDTDVNYMATTVKPATSNH